MSPLPTPLPTDPESVQRLTEQWLLRAVIGLNLCPFAKGPQVKRQIRTVVSPATEPETLLEEVVAELRRLAEADPADIETTLVVHPHVLGDFLDFNDFLAAAEGAVDALDLEGVLQIASFHPDYQFAGTEADDITNFTNRSPYPTLHLIREDSIARAIDSLANPDEIYERNIETLRRLGPEGWKRLWD